MTYCVGMSLRDGLVMMSDSRTNAGVDNIATFRKMTVWEEPGERAVILLTVGNLAVSQSVVTLLDEGLDTEEGPVTMRTVASMSAATRLVGRALREVERIDGPALKAHGAEFDATMILGGQIAGRNLRLFLIYAAGNHIEATPETPYFQIGEIKYGKPILDRVIAFDTSLNRAAKCALISVDSTMRSNISVGPPIDVLLYERDALTVRKHLLIEDDDPYFNAIRQHWSQGLGELFSRLPDPDWAAAAAPAGGTVIR